MQIPNGYDPVVQEERRQAQWDRIAKNTPECVLCRKKLLPGDKFHAAGCMAVCSSCVEELNENIEISEEKIND